MGGVKNSIVLQELKRLKKIIGQRYSIDRMILFGSRSRGDELLTSDVDLLVISRDFGEIPLRKRPDIFLDNWKLPVDLEVLCYAPDEFERKKKEIGLVREVAKAGRLI